MVAEFGHRISLRPKVACRYHFPKGRGIGHTDNRSCRFRWCFSENKCGRVGTFPIGLPVALWLSTASSIGAEPKIHPLHRPPGLPRWVRFDGRLRVATIPVARSVISHQQRRPADWFCKTEMNGKTRKYKSECLMPIHLRFIKWERLLHHKWFGNFRITHKCAKVVHIWTFNPTTVAQSYIKVHTISKLREYMVLGCLAMPQSDATSPSTLLLSEFGLSPYAVSFYLLMH